jgi:phosphoribosylanthranilate isomerase
MILRRLCTGDAVWVKICGVTRAHDARLAASAGADAIGLNFFAPSPRFVTIEAATSIAAALPPATARVGVFVNASIEEMRVAANRVPLDAVQLHGDETPDIVAALQLPVIRALRRADEVEAWRQATDDGVVAALLVDGSRPGFYGGTGTEPEAALVVQARGTARTILSGGLEPANVAARIARFRPWGVDVASGVEVAPGLKDEAKLRAFIAAAKATSSAST